jgi:hypothetical protein
MEELTPASTNGNRQKQLLNLDTFIERAKEKHGDRYDYSKVLMNGNTRYIIIGCKIHGDFNQTPSNHLHTSGCNKCGISQRKKKTHNNSIVSTVKFITKAKELHGDKYDYSKTILNGQFVNLTIICKIHGEFSQIPKNHLNNHGCKECGKIKASKCGNPRLTTEEFIKRSKLIHGCVYDYSNTEYLTSSDKVKIRCKIHGEFEAEPRKHYVLGYGCPICTGCGVSFVQIKWLEYIEKTTGHDIIYKGGKHNQEKSFRFNEKLYRVDGYCKETNTIYEFLGCWYHGCPKCRKEDTVHPWSNKTMKQLYQESLDRKKVLQDNGFTVVYMWECDWKNSSI